MTEEREISPLQGLSITSGAFQDIKIGGECGKKVQVMEWESHKVENKHEIKWYFVLSKSYRGRGGLGGFLSKHLSVTWGAKRNQKNMLGAGGGGYSLN